MKSNLKYIGPSLIAILLIIPVVIWLRMLPWEQRFGSLGLAWHSLGQITGLVGMVSFSLAIILSARIKFFENFFGGLNKVYIYHHALGGLTLIFLLFHPLLLAVKFLNISLKNRLILIISIMLLTRSIGRNKVSFMN